MVSKPTNVWFKENLWILKINYYYYYYYYYYYFIPSIWCAHNYGFWEFTDWVSKANYVKLSICFLES
ncbi:hypothetical protein ACMBCM_10155, partial [Spiroplasma sp. K1]